MKYMIKEKNKECICLLRQVYGMYFLVYYLLLEVCLCIIIVIISPQRISEKKSLY